LKTNKTKNRDRKKNIARLNAVIVRKETNIKIEVVKKAATMKAVLRDCLWTKVNFILKYKGRIV
jgi:hypothetical protein